MATYVNNLRLKEITTGDEDGTWGTSTNTNLELIGEALGYNTQDGFSSDANATTTVADGATDPARALYFKVTSSATLTATRTLTISPDTVSRVMWVENATTGGQTITIKQGSGATIDIPTGETKIVYLDGAGAGAAVVDALAALTLAITSGGTGATTAAAARTNLGVAIGSDVQAYGAVLDDLNTLGAATVDGEFIVATGAGAFAYETGATARTSLGVSIGSDVQAYGAVLDDLNTLGAATADGEFIVATGAGAFAYETGATARASMGVSIGSDVQAYDANTAKTDVAQSFTEEQTFKELKETEYNLTGTVIDPANGTIQYKTLASNTTFTESLVNGQAVTLMIDDGTAYTVTWPTITWKTDGGVAPTLLTSGYTVIQVWKVNSILYGAKVGDA